MQVLAGALGLSLLTSIGFARFNDAPLGGEPIARTLRCAEGAGRAGSANGR
jgi:hypothetical protein